MVSVEPYRWIKSTAIKERLDLANKLNEVIDVLNQYPVNIEDIDMSVSADGVFTFIFTLSDGTTKEMSFSMGDYITNEIASALTDYATKTYVDNKDSENVKKTGTSIVTGDIQVPTPNNINSVVNKQYVDNKRQFKSLTNENWFILLRDDTFNVGDEFNVTEITFANCTLTAQSKYYDENEQQKRFNAVGFVAINNVYYPLRLVTFLNSGGFRLEYIDNNGTLTSIPADINSINVYKGSIIHY